MDRLHGVLVFLNVVETRNFSETARSLGVTTSAVSAAVLRLEQKLGVRLLNRTTRRVSATSEGLEFYRRCKQVILELEEAENIVGRAGGQPSGRVRLGMPSALGRMWVIPRLLPFSQAYPSVSVEFVIGDFLTASDREGLDAIIQVGELASSRMIVRKLADADYVVCASPAYLAKHGLAHRPADLAQHRCISYRRPRNGRIREWRFARGKTRDTVTPDGSLIFNSGEALIAAARAGLGMVQVAEYYARPDLESGTLIEVLPEFRSRAYDISLVFQQRKRVTPRLRILIDFLVDLFDPPPWRLR